MPPSRDEFERLLRRLSVEEFVSLVADLWSARGWNTTIDGQVVIATREDPTIERQTLWIRHTAPRLARPTWETDRSSITHVVTSGSESARARSAACSLDADLLDAGHLREMALYALDDNAREDLFRTYFGRPVTAEKGSGGTKDTVADLLDGRPGVLIAVVILLIIGAATGTIVLGAPWTPETAVAPTITAPTTPESAPTETATPASTETTVPDSGGAIGLVQWPPGLNATGIADPGRLAQAHSRRLADTSYTYRQVERIEAANGTVLSRTTLVIAVNDETRLVSIERANPASEQPQARTIWFNETIIVEREQWGNDTLYHQLTGYQLRDRWQRLSVKKGTWLFAHLRAGTIDPRYSRRSIEDGTARYHLFANRIKRPDRFAAIERVASPGNLTIWIHVDAPGIVHDYRLTYTGRIDGQPVRITRTVTYSGIGSTAVERPPWYGRATGNRTLPSRSE